MTEQEKIIAIAEWRGFRNIQPDDGTLLAGAFKGMLCGDIGLKTYKVAIPDYPNDLNACHEAEKYLSPQQTMEYIKELRELICDTLEWKTNFLSSSIIATVVWYGCDMVKGYRMPWKNIHPTDQNGVIAYREITLTEGEGLERTK